MKRNPILGERVDLSDIHRLRQIHEIERQEAVENDSQVLRISGKGRPKGHAYTAITTRMKGDA